MLEIIANTGIIIFGGSAIFLLSRKDHLARWGYIMGLLSQPFWFYIAISTGQIGVFVMSCWFTYCWIKGIYNYWYIPYKENKDEIDPHTTNSV